MFIIIFIKESPVFVEKGISIDEPSELKGTQNEEREEVTLSLLDPGVLHESPHANLNNSANEEHYVECSVYC